MAPIFFSKTFVDRVWYSKNTLSLLLLPISWIYIIIIKIRSALYRVGIIPISKINVPIIVVGNITAGGTGKTPLVIWLADYFKNKGYCFLLEERFVSDKLFNILINLNKDEKKLFLMKERMTEHSDKDTFYKIEELIEKIINEQN